MSKPNKKEAVSLIRRKLAELLLCHEKDININLVKNSKVNDGKADAVFENSKLRVAVNYISNPSAAFVSKAARDVRIYVESQNKNIVPVVAVPYMGKAGARQCRKRKVSWIDLSGNASIDAPQLRINIEGKPNKYISRGRPSSIFSPNSSRIAHYLLMFPKRYFSQREIANKTGVDEGYVSRIVGDLENAELVIRDNNRKITVRDPDLLLDSWLDEYNFNRNNIVRGTIATRAGEALLEDTSAVFNKMGIKSAATGLGAAWLYTGFAGFRTATFYIEEYPADKIREKLGFYEGARGANVWLAVPKDEGVFIGTKKMNKVECVHPVRAYLDLKKGQPERADEAAEQLRKKWLTWREK